VGLLAAAVVTALAVQRKGTASREISGRFRVVATLLAKNPAVASRRRRRSLGWIDSQPRMCIRTKRVAAPARSRPLGKDMPKMTLTNGTSAGKDLPTCAPGKAS